MFFNKQNLKITMKILFVYPNHKGMNMLPPAIGLLSSCLKNAGHKVELFDTTYYNNIEGDISDSDGSKSERLMAGHMKCQALSK